MKVEQLVDLAIRNLTSSSGAKVTEYIGKNGIDGDYFIGDVIKHDDKIKFESYVTEINAPYAIISLHEDICLETAKIAAQFIEKYGGMSKFLYLFKDKTFKDQVEIVINESKSE